MERKHFSKLDSYSLMIIALSALIVSIWQVNQQRKHDRISVRPYLDWSQSMNQDGYILIDLKNKGFGPAFFEQGELHVGDQRFKDWKQGLKLADSAITIKSSTSLGKFTLLPGEVIHLVAAKGGTKNIDITYKVSFEDAYGQQFEDYMQYVGQPF
ncbi:MAG: hypothetical protein HEP71_21270 [Roseivirga sp.]|nr:hypothetical protein [Roseivirga sp.]